MKDRILKIRKDAGLTQTEFGAELGATRPMIASYEGGKVVPDKAMQMLICSKFNVNYDWLAYGVGEMTASQPFIPELMRVLRNHPDLKAVLEILVADGDQEIWAALNTIARKFVDQKNKKETE